MTTRNEQIGTVPCPFVSCSKVCKLFKYTPRPDGRRSAFTGKWYGDCPDHGRIDGASGQATQDYLLEKGEVWGAQKPEGAKPEKPEIPAGNPESQSRPATEPKPVIPAKEPESKPVIPVKQPATKPRGLLDW